MEGIVEFVYEFISLVAKINVIKYTYLHTALSLLLVGERSAFSAVASVYNRVNTLDFVFLHGRPLELFTLLNFVEWLKTFIAREQEYGFLTKS